MNSPTTEDDLLPGSPPELKATWDDLKLETSNNQAVGALNSAGARQMQ